MRAVVRGSNVVAYRGDDILSAAEAFKAADPDIAQGTGDEWSIVVPTGTEVDAGDTQTHPDLFNDEAARPVNFIGSGVDTTSTYWIRDSMLEVVPDKAPTEAGGDVKQTKSFPWWVVLLAAGAGGVYYAHKKGAF